MTRALVLDAGDADMIHAPLLADAPLAPGIAVLFRTRNAPLLAASRFTSDFCALARDAAELLVKARVGIVGIDYLSIERDDDPAFPVHSLLLSNDVLIAENLDLLPVAPGWYTLLLAPLRIEGGDGAPARAFLLGD
jgi:arylformamidase